VCQEGSAYGETVARLRAAASQCNDILQTVAKNKEPGWMKALGQALQTMVGERLFKAERENDAVFLEKVVAEGLLSEIKAVSMVEPDMAAGDPKAKDLFERLIPLSVHLVASEYSEKKAQVMRDINAAIEAKNIELDQALSAMDFCRGVPSEQPPELPPDLFQKAALLREPSVGMAFVDTRIAHTAQTRAAVSAAAAALAAEHDQALLDSASAPRLRAEQAELAASLTSAAAVDAELAAVLLPPA
jgi:hypothetical protein